MTFRTILSRNNFFIFLYLILSFVTLRDILLEKGHIFLLIDSSVPPFTDQAAKWANEYLFLWNEHNLGLRAVYPSGYLYYVILAVLLRFFDIQLLLRILLLSCVATSGIFMYFLLRRLKMNDIACFIGGYFYSFSPVFFTHITSGRELSIFSYALTPLFIYFTLSIFKDKGKINQQAIILSGLLLSLISVQFQFGILAALIALVFIFLFAPKNISISKKMGMISISIGLAIIFHLPWILPNFLVGASSEFLRSKFWAEYLTGTSLSPFDAITLIGYTFPFFKATGTNLFWIYPVFPSILMSIIFSSLIVKRNKQIIILTMLLLFSIFMLFAPNVFPDLSLAVYEKMPFMVIFRQVYHISFISVFLCSVLLSFLADSITHIKSRLAGFTLLSLIMISLFTTSLPWYTGNFGGFFPAYDFKTLEPLYNDIHNDNGEYRCVWLPLSWLVKYNENSGTWGGDNFARYVAPMITPSEPITPFALDKAIELYYRFYYTNDTEALSHFLGNLNLKYVIVRKNFTAIMGDEQSKLNSIAKSLSDSKEFSLVNTYNHGSVLLFKNNYFKPKIYLLNSSEAELYTPKNVSTTLHTIDLADYATSSSNPYKGWVLYGNSWWSDPSVSLYVERPDKCIFTLAENSAISIPLFLIPQHEYDVIFEVYPIYSGSELSIKVEEDGNVSLIKDFNLYSFPKTDRKPVFLYFQFTPTQNNPLIKIINKKGGVAILKGYFLAKNYTFDVQIFDQQLLASYIFSPKTNNITSYGPYFCNFTSGFDNSTYYVSTRSKESNMWSFVFLDSINLTNNEGSRQRFLLHTRIKGKNVKQSHISICGYDINEKDWKLLFQCPPGLDGTFDWKDYLYVFESPANITGIRAILNGGGVYDDKQGNATTWFDDIYLFKVIPKQEEMLTREIKSEDINYTKINPSLYKVHVDLTQPMVLVFTEAYDPGWVCYVNGEKVNSIPLYGVINGFWINQTGILEITIEYEPQRWFYYGSIISVTTLIACITHLAYGWIKNKGMLKRVKKWLKQKSLSAEPRNT